jgi:hypothetical protein
MVMGLAALAMIYYTHASVRILVVMYSINVFLTFSLSQYGMVHHWIKDKGPGWIKKLTINITGLVLTLGILIVTSVLKFEEGGWVTLTITGGLIFFCLYVHKHYKETAKALRHLDEILTDLPLPQSFRETEKRKDDPTAVLMVNGYNGMGIHSYLAVHKAFPGQFKNFVFLSVGVIDSDRFKGVAEIENLKSSLKADLDQYVNLAKKTGFYAESYLTLETDVTQGLMALCEKVNQEWPKKVFFTGQLVFEKETIWNRLLHNQTAFAIQRKLLFLGMEVVILPIRVRLN